MKFGKNTLNAMEFVKIRNVFVLKLYITKIMICDSCITIHQVLPVGGCSGSNRSLFQGSILIFIICVQRCMTKCLKFLSPSLVKISESFADSVKVFTYLILTLFGVNALSLVTMLCFVHYHCFVMLCFKESANNRDYIVYRALCLNQWSEK